MPRLPPRPDLTWTDTGAPHAQAFSDIYFSGDGLAESRAVFLNGCNLPAAWAKRETYTVGELGFGSGLNLLALWDLWRGHRPSTTARLHFLSFEGYLMAPGDAARVHAHHPELAALSAELLAKWPVQTRGTQRIFLSDDVTLTLCVDEISHALPRAAGQCNAWFLDGFAPARNPDMWSAEAMKEIARLSGPGAIAATYTVAGDVRRNLSAAGFAVEKKPGHGSKRERLEARLPGGEPSRERPHKVAIIGAGIAGACTARAFADRGCEVHVFDAGSAPGAGASGNPTALVMPRLDATDTPEARALISAWLVARNFYGEFSPNAVQQLPAERLARNDRDHKRFARILADPPLPADLLAPLDPEEPGAGYRISECLALRPERALPELLDQAILHFNTPVRTVDPRDDGVELILGDRTSMSFDLAVVCAGNDLPALELANAPPIVPRQGQVECITEATSEQRARTDGGYVVEAFGDLVFGSTFDPADGPPRVTSEARAQNLETFARLRPDLDTPASEGAISSRAGIRATTSDRLPFAGPIRTASTVEEKMRPIDALQLVGGLGARGFLWSPLLGELVASRAFGEPLPVPSDIAALLDPDRFRQRASRRAG